MHTGLEVERFWN